MKEINPFKSATSGIIIMTVYSYLISYLRHENFKEPELLAILARRMSKELNKPLSQALGWQFHYMVGLMFAIIYTKIWKNQSMKLEPNIRGGIILGSICGLVGISFWKTVFAIHPNPPKINFKKFYSHLMLAHLLFGVGTTLPVKYSVNK